ncbi:MAG TPA: beta-propeller fold lactonase family protein [Edaphobacter sp.]|nr:beta-propeller fold lactonase family protein [Edaphobacter sp.]
MANLGNNVKITMQIIVIGLALGLAVPVHAGPIAFGTFGEFSFTGAGIQARGCDPADPLGGFCISSSGTPTLFLNGPAWTFAAPNGGSVLTITDAFESGDRFQIFDFGLSIGLTSAPGAPVVDCGDDPVPCLATAGVSNGFFNLDAGNHSITITPSLSSGGGSGYLRVDAVPEPGTWLLFAVGGGLLLLLKTRKPAELHLPHVLRKGKAALVSLVALLAVCSSMRSVSAAAGPAIFSGPTSSQPLALTADDAFLAVANPDNNSVTFFDLRSDRNRKLAEVPVQAEPNGVAILPDGSKAYVANTISGTVSMIKLNIKNGLIGRASVHIPVGTEPYGLALTPNGHKLYVTNARSNSVSVIDTSTDTVIKTIENAGLEPRGIAITNDGDPDDNDETVYVTQFLSLPIAGKIDGADDAKAGHVTVLSTGSDTITGDVVLNPIADTGFKALGDSIGRIAPGATPTFTTGAYPNQLNNIAIKGGYAYLPNTGASPNGPFRFDVNTHSLLAVINRASHTDAGKTINMHTAVRDQTATPKLFITLPWAMAFKHASNEGYVVSAASNIVVKISVDPSTGLPAVQNDPLNAARVLQLKVGKNPRGIVVNSTDTRAYVMNYVSRDVAVISLEGSEQVLTSVQSASLPPPGTAAAMIQVGKELYNTSVGEFDPATLGGAPITGRMSNNGWGACAACHPFGLSDNVVWIFPSGPKRTIPQHTDFDQTDLQRQTMRALNWSAERDEEEDFELNIRAVSGGQGLIVLADGVLQDPNVANFTPPSANRNQLKVNGLNAWDAIKAFEQFGIRAPISPVSKTDPDVIAGRALFISANCQQCHGGPQWTSSRVRFTPPPPAGLVVNTQLIGELRNVGTFNPAALNEVRANFGPAPLGADGFAPASLLSVFAFPQTFLHNGVLLSFDEVLNNVLHRSAGTGGVDTLSNAADRAKVVRFIQSVDAATKPIP